MWALQAAEPLLDLQQRHGEVLGAEQPGPGSEGAGWEERLEINRSGHCPDGESESPATARRGFHRLAQ